MKKITGICLLMLIALTSIPFSAHAEMNDTEITLVPYDFSEQRYTPEYSESSQITLNSEREDLPSSFDSRDYGWVTPLKRQTWGTCWSHAKMSVLETYNISQGLDDTTADYSESHLTWFTYTAPQNESDPNYGDRITLNLNPDDYSVEGYDPVNAREVLPYLPGADHMTVIAALAKWSGIANESDFPPEAEASAIDESYRYDTGSGFVIKSAEWLNDVS